MNFLRFTTIPAAVKAEGWHFLTECHPSAGYDDVVVTEDFGNTDQYWFISISSVWHEQDLKRITEESVRELVRQNIEYTYWVETYYEDSDEEESDPLYRI